MNGTLFGTSPVIPISRTALIPASGEVIDGTWCRKIAQQEIRAMGWASGTMLANHPEILENSFELAATISLPFNAFGTLRPPIIYVMPRYGSVVIYKQFQSDNQAFFSGPAFETPTDFSKAHLFRTWVHDLHPDNVTMGGVAGFRWSFTIRHKAFTPTLLSALTWDSPYFDMGNGWWPSALNLGYNGEPASIDGFPILLYWYAFGIDTSG